MIRSNPFWCTLCARSQTGTLPLPTQPGRPTQLSWPAYLCGSLPELSLWMAVPGSKISWQKISQQSPFKLACLVACFQGLWGGSKDLGSTNKKKRFSAKNIKKSTHCIIMRNSNILKWGNNNKNNKLSLGLGSKNNTPDKSKIFPILNYFILVC